MIVCPVSSSDFSNEFVRKMYMELRKLDSRNELLKYAIATESELFYSKNHSEDFCKRFDNVKKAEDSFPNTPQFNYGMALSYQIDILNIKEVMKLGVMQSDLTDKF